MTTCAVKVDYVHLIDRARIHIERHFRRPVLDRALRFLIATLIPHPRRFSLALPTGRGVKIRSRALPARAAGDARHRPGTRCDPISSARRCFRARGAQQSKRVALLAGCAQQALAANINAATIRLLNRAGCEVVIAPAADAAARSPCTWGARATRRRSARANVRAWSARTRAARGSTPSS